MADVNGSIYMEVLTLFKNTVVAVLIIFRLSRCLEVTRPSDFIFFGKANIVG